MTNHSNLRDHHSVLVLDASVALNLLGTGQAARVLHALGHKIVMDEHAVKEIITTHPTEHLASTPSQHSQRQASSSDNG